MPNNPSIWKISAGSQGEHWDKFLVKGLIGISFESSWQGDLRQVESRDVLKTALQGKTPHPKYVADQLWDFYQRMQKGDIIIGYGGNYIRCIGAIAGTYQFSEDPSFPYPHRLKVDWQRNSSLPAKVLPPDLYNKLCQRQTIVRLEPEEYAEIEDKIRTAGARAKNLFVITAGNTEASHHLHLSIENPVSKTLCEAHFSKEVLGEVRSKSRDGQFYAWGAIPGRRNIPNWEAIQPNDFMMVCQSSRYTHVTQVISKHRNADFARSLWGEQADQQTWELMYFLQASSKVDVPLGELTDRLNSRYFGFTRISSAKIQKIRSKYGSIEEFVKQRLTSPQSETYLLLRSNEESDWGDEEGRSYHYGSTVPNYTKVLKGAKLLLDRRNPDGIRRILATAQVSNVVDETEKGTNTSAFRAHFDNYRSLIPPRVVTEQIDAKLRELPGFNNQHSIRVLSQEVFEELARPAPAWIFQANPQIYDIRSAVQKLKQGTFSVRTHRDKVDLGDRVYLWESGTESGIVGVAEVVEDIRVRSSLPEEEPFIKSPPELPEEPKALLRIVEAIVPTLSRSQIKAHSKLQNLSIFKQAQGTNFPVTPEEAEILEELLGPDAAYEQALKVLRSLLDPSASEHRDEVIGRYQPIFSSASDLTKEDFHSFLLFDNNHHWTNLHRQSGAMCSDMNRLRTAVAILVDGERPLATRFDEATSMVRGMGKSVATAILLMVYPDTCGVWNNRSKDSLEILKILPVFSRGASRGQQYEQVNILLNRLAKDLGIDLWTLDSLLGRVSKEQPLDVILTWIRNLQTQPSPDGRFYYKPLVLLSLLDLLDAESEHQNSFAYEELWLRFKGLAQARGSQVSEDQFSQPYVRLRNDTNPIQVWIPETNSAVDDNKSDQPSYVRSLIPTVSVDESVWPVFISEEGRKAMRQEIMERWPTPGQGFDGLMGWLKGQGLHFSEELVSNYLLALQSKRFVILTGISGTGKTRLAKVVAEFFQPKDTGKQHYEVVAVRPDWTDNRGLLGYFNPLTDAYLQTPFLRLLLEAKKEEREAEQQNRPPKPFFVILDEMNLARVEHYFSDFLSCLESEEPLDLHNSKKPELEDDGVPQRLEIPKNLFFTGTVNVDETTYMFSPKVLDRAFTIELNEVDLPGYGTGVSSAQSGGFRLDRLSDSLELLERPNTKDWDEFSSKSHLIDLNEILQLENRHFGYRVANEIARYVNLAKKQADDDEAVEVALDLAILQKVLPKFHGMQQELEDILRRILAFAISGRIPEKADLEALEKPDSDESPPDPMFPRTAAKLKRMLTRLRQQGFTSYIE